LNFNAAGFDARRNFEAGNGLMGMVLLKDRNRPQSDLMAINF
jgi:hypothetical protein